MTLDPTQKHVPSVRTADWGVLALLIILAALWRVAVFNGPLGSDDGTYYARALDVSEGVWSSANYNGALRYGFNIPAGLMLSLFGRGEFQLNLWPLLCSLAEIGVVWWFCRKRFGATVAILAATLLLLTPLHVATATRLHADAVANFFLTLAFILFFESENKRSNVLAFLAGLSMGAVFWVKELLGLALLTFLLWPLITHKLERRWLWVVAGGLVMLFGHFLLMQFIAGDPLHAFRTVFGQISSSFIGQNEGQDGALYYVYFILLNISHTSLIGPLALAGIVLGFRNQKAALNVSPFVQTAFWLLALLAVLSLFPVSLSPFRLAMKQSNYLGLFLAPLAILAALALAQASPQLRNVLMVAMALISIPLGMLEQQTYRTFVANSRGAVEFAKAHPKDVFVGTANVYNLADIDSRNRNDPAFMNRFMHLTKSSGDAMPVAPPGGRLIAFEDKETLYHNGRNHPMAPIPTCWTKLGVVTPAGLGFSSRFAALAGQAFADLPVVGTRLQAKLESISRPKPSIIWQLPNDDPWCRRIVSR
jgi:hypothetical protein